jgi:molybdopterin converting factor small subunit
MQVKLRLFASLRDRLPGDRRIHRGRGDLDLADGASLQDLLDRLDIEPRLAQMVLVNGEQMPRGTEQRHAIALTEGDTVSIFPPVAGG